MEDDEVGEDGGVPVNRELGLAEHDGDDWIPCTLDIRHWALGIGHWTLQGSILETLMAAKPVTFASLHRMHRGPAWGCAHVWWN